MFIDEARIEVISGKGGDGIVHFRREKFVPHGGPDGGDGGRGGDVVLQVKSTLNTLSFFQHKRKFQAENGKPGGGNNRTGRSGEDLIVHVPPGTIVTEETSGAVVGDLTATNEKLIVARGGRGGRGNARFATSRNQVPRVAEKGEPAQERHLRLELRLIADIGIVGVPNAGKSTLLAAVTRAKPKIAPYPFTTLEPNLGVAELDDETSVVLADIPGLIEGSHSGVGLGHAFLRHIQRTRVLIHLLNGLAADPLLDYAQINSELSLFDPNLRDKPQIVALNKIDLPEVRDRWPQVQQQFADKESIDLTPASGLTKENVRQLLFQAVKLLSVSEQPIDEEIIPVYRLDSDPQEFTIKKEDQGWRIHGEAIERAAAMTYWEYEQSVRRFQHILQSLGIEDELRALGAQDGDSVYIGDYELEWQD